MSPGVARILERALWHARAGQVNPFMALVMTAEDESGDTPQDHCKAFVALCDAAGGSVFRWYEGQGRKVAETVQLLEEALFQVQMG